MGGKRSKKRLTSFSIPLVGGGLGWERLPSDRDVIEELAIRLGSRRALSDPYEMEDEEYLNQSIVEVKAILTETLVKLQPGGSPFRLVEQLRDGCNTFLRRAGRPRQGVPGLRLEVAVALAKLRESFRVAFTYAAVAGGIEPAAQLARAIPEEPSAAPPAVQPPRSAP